jgi:hypothetical protein
MSNKSNLTVATMGIDIGKNAFHIVGLDRRGAIVLQQRWSLGPANAECRQAAGKISGSHPRALRGW